jgi:hypothetical protein
VTRQLGPALNGLEWRIYRQVPHHRGVRVKRLVWLTSEHPDAVRRTLRELEALGYVIHAGGWWRRA